MRKAITPTLQLLYCLLIPVFTYYFNKLLAPLISTSIFVNLPYFMLLVCLTAASYFVFGFDKSTLINQGSSLPKVALWSYALLMVSLILFSFLPDETVFNFIKEARLWSELATTHDQAQKLLPEAQSSRAGFSVVDLIAIIFFALWEEVIFRGIILGGIVRVFRNIGLSDRRGLVVSLLISSVVFAAYHTPLKIATNFLTLTTLGLIAGALHLRLGLWAACFYHAFYNVSAAPFMYAENGEQTWVAFWFLMGSIFSLILMLMQTGIKFLSKRCGSKPTD